MEGDNIDICKACIKDADNLENPTLPFLFGESNEFNPRLVLSFLPILTAVKKLLIVRVHIHLQIMHVRGQQHRYTKHIFTLARTHQRLKNNYHSYLLNSV